MPHKLLHTASSGCQTAFFQGQCYQVRQPCQTHPSSVVLFLEGSPHESTTCWCLDSDDEGCLGTIRTWCCAVVALNSITLCQLLSSWSLVLNHRDLVVFLVFADWIDLKTRANDVAIGRNTKPIELATGRTLMLYKFENMVFISDANSTAYQFPMTDAKVYREGSSIATEVPLDGTVYDLATGAVLKWCPRDNPMRNLLGTLKRAEKATPLKVYPVHVTKDGNIWTKLL